MAELGTINTRTEIATGAGDVLFQWDGTLNQFTNGGTPEVESGGPGSVLSVATGRFNQPVLRATAGAAAGLASWAIDPSEFPGGSIPSRFVVDYLIDQAGDGVGGFAPGSRFGASHFCQYNGPGDILGWSLCQFGNGNSFAQLWTRNTTLAIAQGTPTGQSPNSNSTRGTRQRHEMLLDLSGTFDIMARQEFVTTGNLEQLVANRSNANGGQFDFDSGNYDGETPNTIGLGADWQASGHFFDLVMFRVLRYPADVGL
jgi:hypothetical protein